MEDISVGLPYANVVKSSSFVVAAVLLGKLKSFTRGALSTLHCCNSVLFIFAVCWPDIRRFGASTGMYVKRRGM